MPQGYPTLILEQRQTITKRMKENSERVPDLAKEYGVKPKVIYNMLRGTASEPNTLLELSRLKREHEALLKIVGQLVADARMGKKI
jgi:transposase-like protein